MLQVKVAALGFGQHLNRATSTLKVFGRMETGRVEFDSSMSFTGIYLRAKPVHQGLATRCLLDREKEIKILGKRNEAQ
ncbi:MAG: hypothetical protein ACYDHX_12495 [Methanothrix sp.]